MKIICSCLNAKYIHSSPAPWCLAAGVKKFCTSDNIQIEVFESTVNSDNLSLIEKIVLSSPDILTFSCYIWNIDATLKIAKTIKSRINTKIVLGGPEVAYRPKDILEKYSFIDFVLTGEGEWCFSDLINAFSEKHDLSTVEGLSYRKEQSIISNLEMNHTETPPSPFSDEYLKTLNGRIAYIESSRGCPFRCAYCLSGRVSNLRFFDIEQIKNDIKSLVNIGTKTIKFVDRTFNASKNHCNNILSFIKNNYSNEKHSDICFHFEISADILDESTIELLSSMPRGLVQLEIGIQSFNCNVLQNINRKCDLEKLTENVKRLISFNNMHIHIDLIAGLTGEDMESFIKGFNHAYSLNAHMLQLGFLKLLHGANMREYSEKFPCNYSEYAPYEVISTPWLSNDDIRVLKKCEAALDRLYNSGRFLFTLQYLTSEIGITPFELFSGFGTEYDFSKMPLKNFIVCIYDYFSKMSNPAVLREKICCDLISCGVNLNLPEKLKDYDPLFKRAVKHFTEKLHSNVKIVILKSIGKIYVVSSAMQKDLSGRYNGVYYDISEISD